MKQPCAGIGSVPADERHQGPLAKVSQALGEVFVVALAERSEPQECKKGDQALKERQMLRTLCRSPTDALALLHPNLPVPLAPLNPGSRSYLPAFRNVPVTTYINGNPMTNYVLVPITDMESLIKAYQLTDDGTPTGNIVATVAVGPMLDVASGTRPTLPIIDWKSGTLQEVQF